MFTEWFQQLDISALTQTLPLLGLYAEIHYRFPLPFSRLFKKEPELIFDTPWRLEPGRKLRLWLLIKDASRYPVHLKNVQIRVEHPASGELEFSFELERHVDSPWHHEVFELELPAGLAGKVRIVPELSYSVRGHDRSLRVDNYRRLKKDPLIVEISPTTWPTLPGWLRGDLHVHTAFTADQIEFGAPLDMTHGAAIDLGLDFITASDHSYDLDDAPDDYMIQDPELKKWSQSRADIRELNSGSQVPVIPAEEISLRNHKGKTVHMLHFMDDRFFYGSGDGGENWPQIRCEHNVSEVMEQRSPGSVSVAAHNGYAVPWLHYVLLGRDRWYGQDLVTEGLHGAQILSGTPASRAFQISRQDWINALLQGCRLCALGGSDAHGNFNRFRQVSMPTWSIVQHADQLLGQVQTLIHSPSRTLEDLAQGLRSRRTAVSTGPTGDLTVTAGKLTGGIGDELALETGQTVTVAISALSSAEFGQLEAIRVYKGNPGETKEHCLKTWTPQSFTFSTVLELKLVDDGYLRLEIDSAGSKWPGVYLSTPIWISII